MDSAEPISKPALSGQSLREAIRAAVAKFLDLDRYELFVFGSEASGVADSRSDIDLGIIGPAPLSGATLQDIRRELETLRTLRVFDVVDFCQVTDPFKTEALRHVERL